MKPNVGRPGLLLHLEAITAGGRRFGSRPEGVFSVGHDALLKDCGSRRKDIARKALGFTVRQSRRANGRLNLSYAR